MSPGKSCGSCMFCLLMITNVTVVLLSPERAVVKSEQLWQLEVTRAAAECLMELLPQTAQQVEVAQWTELSGPSVRIRTLAVRKLLVHVTIAPSSRPSFAGN